MAVFTCTCHGAMQHENPSSTGKSGYPKFVNHINGDKSNSTVENLEWVTAKENVEHAIKFGLASVPENHPGERCRAAKLTDMEVREIRMRIANSESQESIAKRFGVVKGTIGHIKRGTTWSAVR